MFVKDVRQCFQARSAVLDRDLSIVGVAVSLDVCSVQYLLGINWSSICLDYETTNNCLGSETQSQHLDVLV